jgi:phosphoribosylanthranilate isomerase
MIAGVRVKICGLTSLVDAEAADAIGADYLGFIFYPKSPRGISAAQFRAMAPLLPDRKKVAVCVEPTPVDLTRLVELGFSGFQVHFQAAEALAHVAAWSETVGRTRLWLAPKLPPERDVDPAWLPLADTFLLDAFHADKFGGTGQTGDWGKFHRQATAHPKHRWILSGGLSPENIVAAVAATGARIVDVNSGVEAAPGVKDPAKLRALAAALRAAAAA